MGQFEVSVGNLIKQKRIHHKLSREKLAELANINPRFLYDVEIGEKGMSIKTLCKVSHALDISPNDLLEWGTEEIHKIIESLILSDD